MQTLELEFGPFHSPSQNIGAGIVGVVGSGNLEVLFEKAELGGKVRFNIITSVHGFDDTWKAVIQTFAERFQLRDLLITVNDAGATPAVVGLRLMQAVEELRGQA